MKEYYFDKRIWKRRFLKFGLILLISFVPLVLLNIYAFGGIADKRWLVILLDCVILLVFVVIGNYLAELIFKAQDEKRERLRNARTEMEERKIKIMEDSYSRIRREKQERKKEKLNETNKDNKADK